MKIMAKRTEDLRTYWQEIASKAGINPEQIAAVDAALGDDNVAKTFRQAFVPTSDHHSQLDTMKAEYESEKARYEDWYENTAKPAYQANVDGIERLRQYESIYGPIDQDTTVTREDARSFGFNTKAEFEKYLDDRLRAERVGSLALMKAIPKMSVDYLHRFGKVLDPDEIEKIAVKEGLPPDLAYQKLIAPEVEAQQKADFDKRIAEARQEGFKEAATKYHLPVDSTPKDSSPFFDRLAAKATPATEAEADRDSRSAFLDGWNNYAEDIANRHRP